MTDWWRTQQEFNELIEEIHRLADLVRYYKERGRDCSEELIKLNKIIDGMKEKDIDYP